MTRARAAILVVALASLAAEVRLEPTESQVRLPPSRAKRATASLAEAFGAGGKPDTTVERHAYVMGTRLRLAIEESDRTAALARLDQALAAIEDTERELSTWRDDSAISDLNRTPIGIEWRANPRLCRMFETVFDWQAASGGAFDPAIGEAIDAWRIHDNGRIPSDDEVTRARERSGLQWLTFDREACTLTRRLDVRLDVGAFGKGEALDRAAIALGAGAWMIDLGGQISVGGPRTNGEPWSVDLAHPFERDQPFSTVALRGGSLSTSGSSERDLHVDGQRVGHHLDPRTGRPAPFAGSVTVWHERGLVADILSTALFVMGPDVGLRWATEHGLAACYLIPSAGEVEMRTTPAFARLLIQTPRGS